jgi:hypothetical protein
MMREKQKTATENEHGGHGKIHFSVRIFAQSHRQTIELYGRFVIHGVKVTFARNGDPGQLVLFFKTHVFEFKQSFHWLFSGEAPPGI